MARKSSTEAPATAKRNTKPTVKSTTKYLLRIGSDPKLLAEALASIPTSESNVVVAVSRIAKAEADKRGAAMKAATLKDALAVYTPEELAAAAQAAAQG